MHVPPMSELQTGLWHWQAPHPDWKPGEPWDKNVSSYAIDNGEYLLLVDPLAVPSELESRGPNARPSSCSLVRGMSSTPRVWSSGSGGRSTLHCPTAQPI